MKVNNIELDYAILPNYIADTRSDVANYISEDSVSTGAILDVIKNSYFEVELLELLVNNN